ncbi:MAG TPA: hypothetical protein PL187_14870, partial [Caldilinea sp.]|nr:hypothetical protein [Caldilinea sp.]
MRKVVLNLLLISAMVLGAVAPAFAQDQNPDSPDVNHQLFLPSVVSSFGNSQASDEANDEAPPVTVVEVDAASASQVTAGAPAGRVLPAWMAAAKLDAPVQLDTTEFNKLKLSPELASRGAQNVIVRLSQPSVGEAIAAAEVRGAAVSGAEQVSVAAVVEQQQAAVLADLAQIDPSATVLATT